MRKLFSSFWADDRGFIISTEMLFITVICVIGLVAGLAALRNGVLAQMNSVAMAILSLDASYSFSSIQGDGTTGDSNGSAYLYEVPSDAALIQTGADSTTGQIVGSTYSPSGILTP